jgi:hypothetical protein
MVSFRFGVDREAREQLLGSVAFWLVPLGMRHDELYGIRALPGKSLAESPVIALAGGYARTICSNPAVFVPWLLYPGTILDEQYWNLLETASRECWAEFDRVHAALGGTDRLAGARKMFPREDFRRGSLMSASSSELIEMYPRLRKMLDPVRDTAIYFDYLSALIAEERFKAPPACGVWQGAAASAAWVAAENDESAPEDAVREVALQLLRAPGGLDACQRNYPGMVVGGSGAREQVLAAAGVVKDKDIPVWSALAGRLVDSDGRDGGPAYLAAARDMASPVEMYNALISASFWMVRLDVAPPIEVIQAAIALAKEHNWSTVADAASRFIDEIRKRS